MTKNSGHIFEQEFKKSVPENVYCKKLKVAGMNFKGGGNEGDYMLYSYPHLFIFELKSHKGKSIPFSNLREKQVQGLSLLRYIGGVSAGFIFNFRDLSETYFLSIDKILDFFSSESRKSFPVEWCRDNGIKINQKLIRVRYKYDVEKLLKDIGNEKNN